MLLFLPPANAGSGITISADNMMRDNETKTANLDGNVQLVFNKHHLSCDSAKINFESKTVEAIGHVEFTDQKVSIEGQRIFINYETSIGSIYDGFVRSGPMLFEGSVIHKTGPDEYFATDGNYTTCDTCPAGWSFRGKTIKAEIGGYAHIQNATLKFGVVPFIWLPYLIVPLKSTRQTGLLIPTIDYSQIGGFAFSQSFFWAISRSTDFTLTEKIYQKRGLKTFGNYRYVLKEGSRGTLDFATLKDRVFADEDRVNKFRDWDRKGVKTDRWFIKYDHFYQMPEDWTNSVEINMASDLQYPRDFPRETLNHGDAAMENRVSLSKNTTTSHFDIDASYYVNLLHANPMAPNDAAVNRFPQVRYSLATQKYKNLVFNFDLDYVNFARSQFSYDDLTSDPATGVRYPTNSANDPSCENIPGCQLVRDGKFDPDKDLIRTGQRLDLRPSVSYPFRLGPLVSVLPKLSYRETHYAFGVKEDPLAWRRSLRTEVSARTTLSRIFESSATPPASSSASTSTSSSSTSSISTNKVDPDRVTKYKHEIEPEITTNSVTWLDQKRHSFFSVGDQLEIPFFKRDAVSDADLNSPFRLQFDYNDRLYDRDILTLAINNKLMEKYWVGDKAVYRQIASFKLAQTYDAYQARLGNKRPYSDIQGILDVRLDRFETYSSFNYFPYHKVSNASSRVKLLNTSGDFVQVGLSQQFVITDSSEVDIGGRTQDYTLGIGSSSKYLNIFGTVLFDGNWANSKDQRKIKQWAYMAQVVPPGKCWSIFIIHDQVTGGDTNIQVAFDFLFDGITSSKVSPEYFKQYGF